MAYALAMQYRCPDVKGYQSLITKCSFKQPKLAEYNGAENHISLSMNFEF